METLVFWQENKSIRLKAGNKHENTFFILARQMLTQLNFYFLYELYDTPHLEHLKVLLLLGIQFLYLNKKIQFLYSYKK